MLMIQSEIAGRRRSQRPPPDPDLGARPFRSAIGAGLSWGGRSSGTGEIMNVDPPGSLTTPNIAETGSGLAGLPRSENRRGHRCGGRPAHERGGLCMMRIRRELPGRRGSSPFGVPPQSITETSTPASGPAGPAPSGPSLSKSARGPLAYHGEAGAGARRELPPPPSIAETSSASGSAGPFCLALIGLGPWRFWLPRGRPELGHGGRSSNDDPVRTPPPPSPRPELGHGADHLMMIL